MMLAVTVVTACQATTSTSAAATSPHRPVSVPPPPKPEPIAVSEIRVPPTAPSAATGSCTATVNPAGTGCITSVQAGGYFSDSRTAAAVFTYAGAPAAPDPTSIFNGTQVAILRTDGTRLAGGATWRCITCGVQAANMIGATTFESPQPFRDGRRLLAGNNIIDCGGFPLTSAACTPQRVHVFPIYWQNTADGSGPGGSISGIKLNPDNVHVGWNNIVIPSATNHNFGEFAYYARLTFNAHPSTGTPLTPRYELTNVTGLYSSQLARNGLFYSVDAHDPSKLVYQQQAAVGELKGFSGRGTETLGIGSATSDNLDHFATNLRTGLSRRLDANPAYSDPDLMSPDDQWTVTQEVRYQDRFNFIAGLPGVPALTDQLPTASAASDGYNIHQRRLFEPFLEDRYGDRVSYHGQQLNGCTTGPCATLASGPGSAANDPLWASRGDAWWSPDGTQIVYWQSYADSASCGPAFGDPSICPPSSEPGGRTTRLMLAKLTSRHPQHMPAVSPMSDTVPWGTPYHPGDPSPVRPHIPAGNYTMPGKKSGTAAVQIVENSDKSAISSISVSYTNYSDDGANIINGTESVSNGGSALAPVTFHENLTLSGQHTGTKVTSEPGGYTVSSIAIAFGTYQPTGTMTTTIDGHVYRQPPSYG
jgi:hypothetical protein